MVTQPDLRLALTGDSLIARRVSVFEDEPTRQLMQVLHDADVAFTNLEVVPNNFTGYPAEESGGSHLGAHDWVLDELTDMGINLMACPNNHSLNYSIEGLLSTIEILEERGITYAGIGRNLAEARMPAYLDTSAGSVGLIACASTFAKGQQASEQRPDMPGRPGLNPLRYDTTYHVTAEQMDTLRAVAEQLGLERRRLERIQLGFGFPPDDPDIFPFLDANFRVGDEVKIETAPKEKDLEAIAGWVREASMRCDRVVVSLHAHEQGGSKEEPADFIRAFAHRVIEEGADVVVGHGPHLLRGMELHQGKPIFYSLGNFIGQNELTYKIPSDSYENFRIDPSAHPGELYRARTENDQKGFPSDRRYWQTVVPVCRYDGEQLAGIEIVPASLGLETGHHRRGRPRVAEGAEANEIIERFIELSSTYGTRLEQDGDRAVLQI